MENKIIVNGIEKDFTSWDAGMPIGNGRLGAMIPGRVGNEETISLNLDCLWYGKHQNRDNPEAIEHLDEIRSLLMQGKVKEADKLCYMAMTSQPKYYGAYEPMCSLLLFHNYGYDFDNYSAVLDLEKALVNASYTVDGLKIERESFVSYPDQVMVFKISADKPSLDLHANLMRRPCDLSADAIDGNIIHMPGQCGPDGIKFDCFLSAKTDGKMRVIGDLIGIEDASEIIFYVTASADFYDENPHAAALDKIKAAMALDYNELRQRHTDDFSELYNRSAIDFKTASSEPLPERLDNLREGKKDKGVVELIYNYGRYLTISASRPGSQAMNLQGIWNKKFAPGWECNYTININTEMNYWIAESTGLSDCHEPLFNLLERMVPNGEKTAKIVYGCDGFVAHHATDIWGDTSIEGISFPSSVWPMGGAWFTMHMWDHYLYTQDKEFLKTRAFPIMKKAALFFTQYLAQDEEGYYITGPSLSPENVYFTEDGIRGKHCMAPEMDNQILRALLRSVIKAYEVLGEKDDLYDKVKEIIGKIRPTRINKNGGILEWDKDYEETDAGHRHISPLWGLYPDYQINPEKTPELAKACENTLNRRLANTKWGTRMGYFGWQGSWTSACFSRLGDGEKALENLYQVLRSTSYTLLNNVPEFQIDGNFGAAAAVYEFLLQSDEEKVCILPALPKEIDEGSFRDLKARGGYTISAEWSNSALTKATVTAAADGKCRIKANGVSGVDTEYSVENGLLVFDCEAGKTYNLKF